MKRRDPRTVVLATVSGLFMMLAALAILPVAVVTFFRSRRIYARYSTHVARIILRLWGLGVRVHGRPQDGSASRLWVAL